MYTLRKVIRGREVSEGPVDGAARALSRFGPDEAPDLEPGGVVENINGRLLRVVGQGHPRNLGPVDFARGSGASRTLPRVHVAEHQNLVQRLREEIARLKQENAELRSQLAVSRGGATELDVDQAQDDAMLPDVDFFEVARRLSLRYRCRAIR